ncbi:MAG: ECF-type sigma factor [Myxococcota bacterium]
MHGSHELFERIYDRWNILAEVAETPAVSVATVEKDWRRARAWMRVQLERDHRP